MGKHLIQSRRTELILGWGMFAAGALLLRDAYDNRAREVPRFLRPITFW